MKELIDEIIEKKLNLPETQVYELSQTKEWKCCMLSKKTQKAKYV